MPRVDPSLVPVVCDLERGLRELGIPFGIVGALVPELLLDVRPHRMTNDVDVAVVVEGLADFDLLKARLADYGFTRTRPPHRLQHRDGGWVDILPFSEAIARDRLELQEGFVLNLAGLGHVVPNAVLIPIEGGPTLPVAPLPLYVLLKLVAFSDRAEGGCSSCRGTACVVVDEVAAPAPRAVEMCSGNATAVRFGEIPDPPARRAGGAGEVLTVLLTFGARKGRATGMSDPIGPERGQRESRS